MGMGIPLARQTPPLSPTPRLALAAPPPTLPSPRAADRPTVVTHPPALERRGNTFKGFKDLDLKAKARIWL